MMRKVMKDNDSVAQLRRCKSFDAMRTARDLNAHPSDRAAFDQQIRDTLKSLDKRSLPANDTEIIEAYNILKNKAKILSLPHFRRKDGWKSGWT